MTGSVKMIGFGESPVDPAELVTNDEVLRRLEQHGVDIGGKTGSDTEELVGIRTRWWSRCSSTDHARAAAEAAIRDAGSRNGDGFQVEALRLIHSGGSSPDHVFPACACQVQGALGVPPDTCEARDVSLACSSWLDALLLAVSRMRDKGYRYGLVTVGESIGTRLNAPTSLSHTLWGDGGGAVVLELDPDGEPGFGVLADRAIADGQYADWTRSVGMGTHPEHRDRPFLDASMLDHGKDIHRYVIRTVSAATAEMLEAEGLQDEPFYLLPHNSNLGMMLQIARRLGVPEERVLSRIRERGNTSSASIPITLAHYAREGTFHRGDLLVLAAFGGGMAIDLLLYRWP
jgi:3-oxoacyl-[acyl-carrier-protein] synthase-3